MTEIKRWYDASPKLEEMMRVLETMPDDDLAPLAKCLYQVVTIFKKQKRMESSDNISIGRDKLFGYYKAYQKRRWYDKNPSLSSAINALSTMEVKDIEEIIDGFMFALKDAGMYHIYYKKQHETGTEER